MQFRVKNPRAYCGFVLARCFIFKSYHIEFLCFLLIELLMYLVTYFQAIFGIHVGLLFVFWILGSLDSYLRISLDSHSRDMSLCLF